METTTTNLYKCTRNALVEINEKNNDRVCVIVEALMTVQFAINSLAESELRKLCDMLIGIKSQEGRDKYGIHFDYGKFGVRHEAEMILNDLNEYDRQFIKTLKTSADMQMEGLYNRTADQLILDMCNQMDDSDDMLAPHVNAIKDYLKRKTPIGGDCCPLDPLLMQQILLCEILSGIAMNVYDSNKVLEPVMERFNVYSFSNFRHIYRRVGKIWKSIKLLNKYNKPLRYNVNLVLNSTELKGTLQENGNYEGGIICRFRDAIYSTNFLDHCLYIRDGIDYGYRNDAKSLIQGMKGDNSIKIA